MSGVNLTAAVFTQTADIFQYVLAVAVVMFAFSTMISCFVVVGASVSFGIVIDFSDAAIFAMSIFNIIGLYFLMPVVKEEQKS